MKRETVAMLVLVVLTLIGCGSVEEAPPVVQPEPEAGPTIPSDFSATLERTACRGTCPVYQLTVNADGGVVFNGAEHVAQPGTHQDTLEAEAVEKLVAAIEASDFFNLAECYCERRIFDVPTSVITVTMNGASHTVRHLKGNDAPPEYLALEEKIDLVTRSKRWIEAP